MTPGKLIYNARIKLGMTQNELAEKLGFKSSMFISLIENDKAKIPVLQIKPICDALDLKKDRLADAIILEMKESFRRDIK